MKNTDILKILPSLKEADLKAIKAITERLLQQWATEDEAAAGLLQIINETLGTRVPYKAVKAPWVVNAGNVAHFIDTAFGKLSKVKRYAMFKMCVGLVVDHLRSRNVPVTFGTVWVDLVRVPELFDRQFPDYRASGLCALIVKAMERK
jgi:hypothetical protein